jgi:hypothetical protein
MHQHHRLQQTPQEHLQHQQVQLPLKFKVNHEQQGQQALGEGLSVVEQACTSPPYPQVTVTGPTTDELDISLNSAAEMTGDDLGFMDRLLPLDMAMFDQLSPALPTEDFSFSMDNSTEGINDLFDL